MKKQIAIVIACTIPIALIIIGLFRLPGLSVRGDAYTITCTMFVPLIQSNAEPQNATIPPPSTATATATSTTTPTNTATATSTSTATATSTATTQPAVCACYADLYNCSDLATQAQAQACFDHCWDLGYGDVHHLDSDGDGEACESLP